MTPRSDDAWRKLAQQQAGLVTRPQLAALGMNRWAISHRVESQRWQRVSPQVFVTTTGAFTPEQRLWAAVLHGGDGALLGGLSAAADAGLQRWSQPEIEVLLPHATSVPDALEGVRYRRTRRDLRRLRDRRADLPTCRLEPAVLMFAASERSERGAAGVLAAVVQQRLTSPELLLEWLEELAPLRRSSALRRFLSDIAGGAQSLGEMDVARMCRRHRITPPRRQVQRRDASGRLRFTDCEWLLADGRLLILEVDGSFHMDVEHWEDDLARQRGLSATDRLIVRCTTRELRDTPDLVARDLLNLGVPHAGWVPQRDL